MQKGNSGKKHKNKKVVVVGIEENRHAAYLFEVSEAKKMELNINADIVFFDSAERAHSTSYGADIVVVNIDRSIDFPAKLFNGGYEGEIITVTNKQQGLTKAVKNIKGRDVYPISCRMAPQKVVDLLKAGA